MYAAWANYNFEGATAKHSCPLYVDAYDADVVISSVINVPVVYDGCAVRWRKNYSDGGYEGCYRILERWGYLNGEDLIASGVSEEDISSAYPEGLDEAATYESCIWMTADGKVIKAVLSPLEGVAIPYCFFQPYKDEAGFWSEGLCDRLRPTQESISI